MAGTYSTDDLLLAILIELRAQAERARLEIGEDADEMDDLRLDQELRLGNGSCPYQNPTLSVAYTTE